MDQTQALQAPLTEAATGTAIGQKDLQVAKEAQPMAHSDINGGQGIELVSKDAIMANTGVRDGGKVSPSEEKTGVDLSKQPTQKETSLTGKHNLDDSSSSSSDDDDDSDDYPQAKAPVQEPKKDVLVTGSNPEQNLNQSKPVDDQASIIKQTQNQQIESQKEEAKEESQALKVSGAEGEKPSAPENFNGANNQVSEPVILSKTGLNQEQGLSEEKITKIEDKIELNNGLVGDKQTNIAVAAEGTTEIEKSDAIMQDENQKISEANQSQQQMMESQQNKVMDEQLMKGAGNPQSEKESLNKQVIQSQSLWGAGNVNKDEDMAEDDDDEHMDPEFKLQCQTAQDNDKLFTLNINTYQVCKLNILLSTLGMKMDPKEQVLSQIKKREIEDRNRKKKQNKLQKKLDQKIRTQPTQEVSAHTMPLVAGSQANARFIKNQQSDEVYGGGQLYKAGSFIETNGVMKADGSQVNDPQSMSSFGAKEQKSGAQENQQMNANDKSADASNDINGGKESSQHGGQNGLGGGLSGEHKVYVDPNGHPNESDLRALSPTPRKSERERPPVSYPSLNTHGRRNDTDDDVNGQVGELGHHGQNLGSSLNQKHKKPQDSMHNQAKKQSTDDANKRIRDFFMQLSQHEHSDLMNQPLSKNNPLWATYKFEWKALTMIQSMHRCGKYTNSKDIFADIDNLILIKFNMLQELGEDHDYKKVQDFQQKYIELSGPLDNLSLSNKPDKNFANKKRPDKLPEPSQHEQKVDPKKKKKPMPTPSDNKIMNDSVREIAVDMSTGIEIKAVKAITQEDIAELKRDIMALSPEQRAEIENVVPECITTNAVGNKNIELNNLKANPDVAAKLFQFVKKMTKKNQQRESRRKKDQLRREKKQREKALNNGPVFNQADAPKAAVHQPAASMGGSQSQPLQAFVPAQNPQAADLHQAQFPANPQMAQFQPGFNYKPGFPPNAQSMTAAPNQQQQQFLNQIMMNQMLSQHAMTPAALQQMMYQMQQQPGANGQAQAALQKQAGVQGQVGGMQQQNDGQGGQTDAGQKKGVANRAAQDDGSSSQSSSSDSDDS